MYVSVLLLLGIDGVGSRDVCCKSYYMRRDDYSARGNSNQHPCCPGHATSLRNEAHMGSMMGRIPAYVDNTMAVISVCYCAWAICLSGRAERMGVFSTAKWLCGRQDSRSTYWACHWGCYEESSHRIYLPFIYLGERWRASSSISHDFAYLRQVRLSVTKAIIYLFVEHSGRPCLEVISLFFLTAPF